MGCWLRCWKTNEPLQICRPSRVYPMKTRVKRMFAKTRRQFETKLVLKGRLKVSPYGVAMSDSVSDTPVTPRSRFRHGAWAVRASCVWWCAWLMGVGLGLGMCVASEGRWSSRWAASSDGSRACSGRSEAESRTDQDSNRTPSGVSRDSY